jgi:Holliday junction resolvase
MLPSPRTGKEKDEKIIAMLNRIFSLIECMDERVMHNPTGEIYVKRSQVLKIISLFKEN